MDHPTLCITDVEAIPLTAQFPQGQETSQTGTTAVSMTLVKITTDAGLVGYGESLARFAPQAYATLIHELLRPSLLGADPFDAEGLWRKMWRSLSGRAGGVLIEALAGVDIALWDLMGKATGLPIYKLLGGMGRTSVQACASSIMANDDAETEALRLRDAGFKIIKLKVRGSPRLDLERARTASRVLGDWARLCVDANWAYDLDTAIMVGRGLADAGVFWFEEPLVPEDIEGYRRLRAAVPIRLAAGESDYTVFGASDLIASRSIGVVQPDVTRAGGITEVRRIATLADAFHVGYAPHVGFSGVICAAASLHLAAAMPNFLAYECMINSNPLRRELAKSPVDEFSLLNEGMLPVPQGPGLGIEIDEASVERMRVR